MFEVRVPPASVLRGEISGDESRENEIEFCVREEREREREKKRGKIHFVITGVTGSELVVVVKIRLWWDRDFGRLASHPNFWPPVLRVLIVLGVGRLHQPIPKIKLVSADLINRYKKYVAEADLIS
jgi:hypothetical protein